MNVIVKNHKAVHYLIVMPRLVDDINEWYWFPLGIAYISSSMKSKGFIVVPLNLNHRAGTIFDILKEYIEKYDIEVLLTGGLTGQYGELQKILSAAKEIKPQIITIVGGGIITSAPEVGMEALGGVDYGVVGEGEITVCELCTAIDNNDDIDRVDGVIYRKNGTYCKTNIRKELEDLNKTPIPDYKGFEFNKLMECSANQWNIYGKQTGVIIASRSCPFQCTFCFHSSGSKYRQRSVNNLFEEIDYLVNNFNVKNLFISDELFSYSFDRVKEFCFRIKPYGIKWFAQFRVSDVTEEIIQLVQDSGCVAISYGLESADNSILTSMRKHTTVEQIERALQITSDNRIGYLGGFIFGDKEETLQTAKNTLSWWENHSFKGINLSFIITYPGTFLYQYACEKGLIKNEVQFVREGCPIINVSKMTEKEFGWVLEEIERLMGQKEKVIEMGNITVDYIHGLVNFDGRCSSCHWENTWHNISLFRTSGHGIYCKKCGAYHSIPLFKDVIGNIHSNITDLVQKDGKVAIWGMGKQIQEILEETNLMWNPYIYLVDDSKVKQNQSIGNKVIYSPLIVQEEKIKTIIIYVPFYFEVIKSKIENIFEEEKNVINIISLINPRYSNAEN